MPLLEARKLKTWFPVRAGLFSKVIRYVKAVDQVDITVNRGEIVSLVGESGSGKSTLGLSLLGLTTVTSGSLFLDGHPVDVYNPKAWKKFRRDFQIIYQDSYDSLNPRITVYEIISRPMITHGLLPSHKAEDRVAEILEQVGLSPDFMYRFPHAFSGGQRQRINIGRVLGMEPKLIICDEIISSLDVHIQSQILDLIRSLNRSMNITLLFISHDLAVVKQLSKRLYVMNRGKIVESGGAAKIFKNPRHPYTRELLMAVPTLNTKSRRRK